MRTRLLEGAARLLAEEGPSALTLRRVAAEASTSTMSVYTHFGSMAMLADAVVTEGFARLAALLADVPRTDDAIADIAGMGLAYLVNARQNPHLYAVMFGTASLGSYQPQNDIERATGQYTFDELIDGARRAVEQGQLRADDPGHIAAQLWTAMHGYVLLDVGGYFRGDGIRHVLAPMFLNLLTGLGANPDDARASIRVLAEA